MFHSHLCSRRGNVPQSPVFQEGQVLADRQTVALLCNPCIELPDELEEGPEHPPRRVLQHCHLCSRRGKCSFFPGSVTHGCACTLLCCTNVN